MRVIVLGGTGFIGSYVVRALAAPGNEIGVVSRGKRRLDLAGLATMITAGYKRLPGFRDIFQKLAPDVVVDMIPMTEQDARNVVDTFRDITPRIVVVSSQDVYRAYGYFFGLENTPCDPHL